MNVKYAAPFLDYSGYGQTSRHHIAALDAAGVKVGGELLSYQSEKADYGKLGPLMHDVAGKKVDYKIKILHTTPDEFERLHERGKYHVGFMYWETDKIPQTFAEGLNTVDEVWTGCQANFDAIRKAGVSKPIKIIPQPMFTDVDWPEPYEIVDFEGFLFYSVFEWTDRKNPTALIKAFLNEFKGSKGSVGLVIKTYFKNFAYTNKKMIRNKVELIRQELGVDKEDVPIFLYLDLMDRKQILRLHKTGDCFVSTHRGEGWGLPQVEAMLAGNPIISTKYSGVHEYLKDGETAYLIDYEMTRLRGMLHSQRFYAEDQQWADVKLEDVQKALRKAYDNQKEAKNIGRRGQQFVEERFNIKRVGNEMADRLKEIEASL